MQYEVSMTVCMGMIRNQRKVPKWLQVRTTKYLMCIYGGHMCICIPNMKFLCLTLWQREVCTDDANADANADDANANDDGQSMIVQGPLVDKWNESKIVVVIFMGIYLSRYIVLGTLV